MRHNNKVNGVINTPDATLLNFRPPSIVAVSRTRSTHALAPTAILQIKL